MKTLPPVRISRDAHEQLEAITRDCLQGCRTVASDGTPIYRPDASGHYAALWTRDFCYMVEGAGHLLPAQEVLAGIDYLLAGQREDGVIPDRVQADGTPVYQAGPVDRPLGSGPPADNGPFMAKLLCAYVRHTRDYDALRGRIERLDAAMAAVPLEQDGLVYVDRNNPHPGYGFTDCVAKTGKVFFESLLYWEACETIAQTYRSWEYHDEAHEWFERAERAEGRLQEFWSDAHGMFLAASRDCRQLDIWASAYASVIRVASKTQAERVGHYLRDHRGELVLEGHVRHLPAGETWQRLLADVPAGTYQNGGFWAVPTGWYARTVALVDEDVAREVVLALLASFAEHGACEWINPEQRALPGYGASAANLLGSVQRSKK